VFQGEREIAAYNKKLGMFELAGIAPAPRGIPQIEVAFDIDANGIVNVSAKDLGTGKEQRVTITGGSALGKDEINRMMSEAEKFAEEDARRRDEAETRNRADTLAYQTEKFVAENAEKIPEATEKAAQVSQKMGTAIYAQSQAASSAAGEQTADASAEQQDDEVVEAEIVDEEKPSEEGGAA
jgi:molecular chaperone DnaK